MVIAMLRLVPHAAKRREAVKLLTRIEGRARLLFGCASASVFEQVPPGQTILYVETWLSEEELNRHVQSDLFLWTLKAMELASEPPEICFHRVSDTSGLDLVESLRGVSQGAGDRAGRTLSKKMSQLRP